jgi:hypothetical protein
LVALMTWTFSERAGSRQFTVSDDGTARGVVAFIATTTVAADATNAPQSIWEDLSDQGWAVGDYYSNDQWAKDSGAGDFVPFWVVDKHSGAVSKNAKNAEVWNVDLQLVGVGSNESLTGQTCFNDAGRRDIEIQVTGSTRAAASYRDWKSFPAQPGAGSIPAHGDVDWATPTAALEITAGDKVDVNGAPIALRIPGAKLTVSILQVADFGFSMDNLFAKLGLRNSDDICDFLQGTLLFQSFDQVQISHRFERVTLHFLYDEFFHLEQEPATSAADRAPIFDGTEVTITTDITVNHVRALWRQPFGVTTDGWVFEDLIEDAVKSLYLSSLFCWTAVEC